MFIYVIENTINGKQYVGQTTKSTPQQRFNEHLHYLRKGTHRNKHLQHAWNKDGEDKFEFRILKECTNRSELNKEEERLIKYRGDYNIAPGGDNKETSLETRIKIANANRKKPYPKIVDSSGNIHTIGPTLEEFCRIHDLTSSHLRAVIAGRINYCSGWHLTSISMSMDEARSLAHRNTEYSTVVDPSGQEYQISNFRKFCRDHNLNLRHFKNVIQGKVQQHKGWHIKGTTIVDPNVLRSNLIKGAMHPSVRWNEELVLEIRAQDLPVKDLAKKYQMPYGTVWNIVNRKTWTHI